MGSFTKGRGEIVGHFCADEVGNDEESGDGHKCAIGCFHAELIFDFCVVVEVL